VVVVFDIELNRYYALAMEITFPRELEDKLSRVASELGRDRSALVVEAVERLVDYDAWLVAEVGKGLAQVEAGQTLSHDEVGARLKRHLAAKRSAA
jgi:predicted transcriptional regulator